jgi:hypothetical protein
MSKRSKKNEKRRKRHGSPPPQDDARLLDALAARQGVKPIVNVDQLYADFWPKDETADQIIEAVRRWSREGEPKGRS